MRELKTIACAALLALGCSGLSSKIDAGVGGGSGGSGVGGGSGGTGGGGFLSSGGGTGGSAGSGGASGGGQGGSSGGGTGGGTPDPSALKWFQLAAPSSASAFVPVGGSGINDVYYANGTGQIWRFNGSTHATAFTNTAAADSIASIAATADGAVFAGGHNYLFSCKGSCGTASNWVPLLAGAERWGVCALDKNTAWAVGYDQLAHGFMRKWNGSVWSASTMLPDNDAWDCHAISATEVLISSRGQISIHNGTATSAETIDWGTIPAGAPQLGVEFHGFGAFGSEIYVAASDMRIFKRDGVGNWSIAYEGNASSGGYDFDSIAMIGPGNGLAVGGIAEVTRLYNGVWKKSATRPTTLTPYGVWAAADAGTFFAVGESGVWYGK